MQWPFAIELDDFTCFDRLKRNQNPYRRTGAAVFNAASTLSFNSS
jgi:hypothetical protein